MKYLLYRFPDALEWDDEDKPRRGRSHKHDDDPRIKKGFQFPIQPELVAVEYGEDIDRVADTLIQAITDELSGMEEYARFECYAYSPDEPMTLEFMTDDDFDYEMKGIVGEHDDGLNTIIYFGVKEVPEA